MTTLTPCPKPPAITDAERRLARIASLKKLERSRRLPLSRGESPKRSGKPKPVNRKRKASEFARCYHSKARVAFVKRLPCPVCLALGMQGGWTSERDNAHIVGGGAGRKAGYDTIVPLCRHHHRALHAAGSLSAFYVTFGCKVDLAAEAARTEQQWLAVAGREGSE